MRVIQCPVLPVPNPTVLSELQFALTVRQVEIRRLIGEETPEHQPGLQDRAQALEYLLGQIRRIKEQTAPTIDVVAELVPSTNPPASDNGNVPVT